MAFNTITMILAVMAVGIGIGSYQPLISATVAKCTTSEDRNLAYSIYYWIVNLAAFLFPLMFVIFELTGRLPESSYYYVFLIGAIMVSVNIFTAIFTFEEVPRSGKVKTVSDAVNNIKIAFKNIQKFKQDIRNYEKKVYRAASSAAKIEGFKLRELLQWEIITGTPGGQPFKPMRRISKLSRKYQAIYGSRLWDRTKIPAPHFEAPALRALAIPVRYEAKEYPEKIKIKVGILKDKTTSGSWRKIAYKQQEGFKVELTPLVRKAFATWPLKLAETGKPHGIYFPKSKTHLNVPARPVIEPFWRKYQKIAYQNIKKNFEQKMAGKYVK